ncbi:MAG: Ig-like domain repeat protein, partial [Treponema sp.]|nr:Ig-like domain repeat protein [Treponema sp.]
MGKILKRLAPALLLFGLLSGHVRAGEREILNLNYNESNELKVIITLENVEECTKTVAGGVPEYLIDVPTYFGVEIISKPPSNVQYEVSVDFLTKSGVSYYDQYTSLNTKTRNYAPTREFAKVQVTVVVNKFSSNKWTLYETMKSYVTVKYAVDISGFYYYYSPGSGRASNASSVTVAVDSDTYSMGKYGKFFTYKINNAPAVNGYSVTLANEGTYDIRFYFQTGPNDTVRELRADVMIDRTRPALDISGLPAGVWTNSTVTLVPAVSDERSGIDDYSLRCSEDGGKTWQSIAKSNLKYEVSKEGTASLVFSVKDAVGNEATKSVTVRIDKTLPSIVLSGNMGENVWARDASRTLTVTASDSLSGTAVLETRLNNGAWVKEANTASASFAYTGEGIFTRDVRAADAAGNARTSSGTVRLDRQGPVISGFAFPSGWARPNHIFSGIKITDSTAATTSVSGVDTASFTVTPSGKSGIAITSAYNASTGALADFTLPGLSDGSYSLTFSAKDKAGNTTSVVQSAKVDNTAPQISVSTANIAWKGNGWSIPVKVTVVKEEHSGINPAVWKYKIDGGNTAALALSLSNGAYSGEIAVSSLGGGNHTLAVTGADNAGNECGYQTTFTIDSTPPVISYDALFAVVQENAPWTNARTFAVSAADAGSNIREFTAVIKRGLSNGQWAETGDAVFNGNAVTFLEGIADGVFQFKFRAVDNAANVKEETLYARIDRTGPAISAPSGLSGVNTVAASAADALSGVDAESWEWRTGGGSWQKGRTATLSEGKDRAVSFRLKDKAGNLSEKSTEITIDLSPPLVGAEVPEYAFLNSLGVKISASDVITAVKNLWYAVDDGPLCEISGWSAAQTQIPVENYQEGNHLLRFTAEDSVAHKGQSREYAFIIDR